MDQSRHLDPERLAAFMDGSLPRVEREAVEAHAADCADCLQLLAAMARTEPLPPPTRWRPSVALRWAVPLAAGATALALWINVAQDRQAVAPQQAAQPVPPATVPEAPTPVSKPDTLESRIQQPQTLTDSAESTARGLKRPVPESAAKNVPQPQNAASIERQRAGARTEDEAFRLKTAEEKREVSPRRDASSATPAAAPAATPPAAAAPTAVAERPPADRQNQITARSLGARQALMPVDVVSPNPTHRWRAVGTAVQRSTDGGKAWTTQVSAPAEVLAGSSPSPNVCWLVGRAGTVLLTADGTNWQRLSFPAAVDATAVRATNDREAEVTTADGRVFRTADGGRTWSLQETSGSSF